MITFLATIGALLKHEFLVRVVNQKVVVLISVGG